jgi:hypothetical protein
LFRVFFKFDDANLKQRVFKNKKCQRFFSPKSNFFSCQAFLLLKINFLQENIGAKFSKTKRRAEACRPFLAGMLFDKLLYFCWQK